MATVSRDKPRQVSLVDPDNKPVMGATSEGLTFFPWDHEPRLRAASFPVTKLHPDRLRRITFVQEDRKLIGFLGARGDGEAPYTVRNPFSSRLRTLGISGAQSGSAACRC